MKKVLSLVLSLVLIIGIMPQISVQAASVPDKLKTDYIAGNMPQNLFVGQYMSNFYGGGPNYNHNVMLEGETSVAMDVESGLNSEGHLTLTAKRDLPDPHIQYTKNATTGYHEWDGVSYNYNWPLSGATTKAANLKWTADDGSYSYNNGNVVFSFEVYNNGTETGKINFGRVYSGRTSSKDETEFPVEYSGKAEGLTVTASSGARQVFSGTFKDNGAYTLDQYIYCLGLSQGTPKDTQIRVYYDNIYIGVEEAYEIKTNIIGNNAVAPGIGGKITVAADILNQIGKKGALDQDVSWHILNDDRTEYASGIVVEEGDDGTATLEISAGASVGTYTVVAESVKYPHLVSSAKIYIKHEDYTPGAMPENLLAEGATAADLLGMNYNHHFKYGSIFTGGYTVNPDVMVTENSDGSVTLTAKRALSDPHAVYVDTDGDGKMDVISETETNTDWAFSGAYTGSDVLNLPAERGALVYMFKVSNNSSGSVSLNFGRNTSPLYPVEYNGTSDGMSVLASSGKWQVLSGTIPDDGATKLNQYSYSIGMPEGTVSGATAIIKADEMYFGIEEAYDIENKVIGSNSVPVGVGGKISVDADIVNQIYSTGSLTQGEFTWSAYNAERTELVDGITVTAGENGTATVNVSANVPCGVYDIVASSKKYSGFIKGVKIYVVLPEDAEAEGLTQHVALDFEDGLAECTAIGSTAAINDGALSVDVTAAGGMATFPIRTEAGNKYKISAWVRADGDINTQDGYFVFTNKAQDGGNDVINEVPVTHTASFAQGEWVYVTAEYRADGRGMRDGEKVGALLSGTVGFRFGSDSTLSYSIDELFVIPEVDNKLDYNDVFTLGSFDTDASLNEWTVWANEGGTLTTEQQKTNGFSYIGYKNKPGALELDGIRAYDSIRPAGTVGIVYGRAYRMSFYAKAVDDEAVGQPIWFYLSYRDEAGDGYDPVFNKFYHVNNVQNPTLTKEWQYFEIDFDYDFIGRNLAEMSIGFRVSDIYNKFLDNGGRPHYMIDNVSLKQIGGEDFVVDADVYGDVATGATIKLNYVESTKGKFLYRIVRETFNGEYCIATDFTESEVIDFTYTDDLGEDTLRLDLIGTDAYGNYSQLYTMPIEVAQKENKISFIPNGYFWNNDTESLSATLTYESDTDLDNLNVYAALYDANDKFIVLGDAVLTPERGVEKSVTASVDTVPNAVKAKFFAWYEGTNKPVSYADEICKSIGEFIYVDASCTAASENGTKEAPFKSVSAAVSALEEIVATTEEENVYVVISSGEYLQTEAIDLSSVTSISDKNIIFTTDGAEKATISGGMRLKGSDFTEYESGIYRAKVPDGKMSRQLYVNGIKATRARSAEDVGGFTNLDSASFANNGLSCTDTSHASYKYPNELELVFIENWCHYYIMPDSITETDGKSIFTFTDGGNASAWEKLMTERTLPATTPVYLENALELLDEPGEWYLDTHENYLYYMPRSFENISTAEFVMPVAEQLLVAEGTADAPVKNISFKNIEFKYSAWNYPTTNRYFLPSQALYYQNLNSPSVATKDGDEIVDGALQFENVHNLTFDNCDFAHLGSNGLVLVGAVQNCDIIGNEFYEISGNAINLGEVTGTSFNPADSKYFVCDNVIADNYIHKIADDYYSAAGIVAGYPKNTVIRNNEITDMPYCGIHAGWGWSTADSGGTENLVIENNYIHNTMNNRLYDGAPIYVVGKTNGTDTNPNLIRGNYIADTKNLVAGIYPDDGSNYWKISENVIDTSRYQTQYYKKESQRGYASWLNVWTSRIVGIVTKNNYSTTTHYTYAGTAGSFEQAKVYPNGDWCDEALAIIDKAGISGEYQDRFDFDIQTLTLPGWLTMSAGATENIYYDARTSKDKLCDLSGCEITVKSSDENVVTVTGDAINGVSAGKAWITYIVCKKDSSGKVIYYDEYSFCVIVE